MNTFELLIGIKALPDGTTVSENNISNLNFFLSHFLEVEQMVICVFYDPDLI